ncbi:unnamed protein product [Orchesella dallaii]|uniref:Uncharacterized protein n=1 Tax=Orchesella dallaii TaxID=48710 RepID=A0ABP1QAA3_9HEXA
MKLLKTAFLLSSLLFISVSGGRKSHHHKTSSVSPSTTSIVESDAMPAASSQAPVSMAQSRSSAINERSQGGGYSQQIYSDPFDPAMMSASSIPEASYYEPPVPTPHHHSHHHAAAAAGHYHHHVPAPPVAPHARHAGAGPAAAAAGGPGSYAAASSVAPYAAVPYHQPQGYYGYGYDYPPGRYAAQGSAHQDAYVGKRAHGYGGGYGWHPDLEIQTLFFIGIPLIIIPLLFLWPYFLYSLHSRGGGHSGGWGGYRAASGTPEVVATPEKVLEAKTEELTKKIVPKLSKKSVKSSSKSSKTK